MGSLQQYLEGISNEKSDMVVNLSDFIFGGVVGKGGFGEVRKAVQISTQRYCAAKQIFENRIEGKRFKRYIGEIETMLKCDNMFLVPLVGFTIEPPYTIITEYMPGGSLEKSLQNKENPLSPTQLTFIAIGIANGMMSLHANGVIHRDLKAANILLDDNTFPRIADFGIAVFEKSDTHNTESMGTPQYMAPELISGADYDRRIDVYAYGLILYEMLEQKKAFKDLSVQKIFETVVEKKIRPKFTDKANPKLRELITQCWDQDPNKRPSFEEIYNNFAQGKVMFAGTDKGKVQKFVQVVQQDNERRKEMSKLSIGQYSELTHMLLSFVEETAQVINPSEGNIQTANGEPGETVLANYKSPLFEKYVTYYSETIDPSLFEEFYTPLSSNLVNDPPPGPLKIIIKACNLLMKRNSLFAKLLLDAGYFTGLPLSVPDIIDDIVTSYTILLTEHAELLCKQLMTYIALLTNQRPEKMLVLLSFYLKTHNPKNTIDVIDCLLTLQKFMLSHNCGYLYLSIFLSIAETTTEIDVERAEKVQAMFVAAASSKVKRTRASAYVAIAQLFPDISILNLDSIIDDLSDPQTQDAAIMLLAKHPMVEPPPKLYKMILELTKDTAVPWIYLLKIAETPLGSKYLINNPQWVEIMNERPAEVCRVFLVLCMQSESRETLFEMPMITRIFHAFLKLRDEDAQLALAHILTRWISSPERLSSLSNADFLRPFFNASIISSVRMRQGCLQVVIASAKQGYTEEFCIIARHITELMKVPELTSLAIFASSGLSQYQQCASLFKNEQLVKFFNDLLNYPEYKQAAEYFLEHVRID